MKPRIEIHDYGYNSLPPVAGSGIGLKGWPQVGVVSL